mmetsp:Transcript_25124/g.63228  ORF Transcript_25124/g.63228 Transcript_25124/m.63228 type:complete len:82 (+) Transcript_25124:4438-4683(+)
MKSRVLGAEESSELPAEDQAPAPRAPSMRKTRVVESTQKKLALARQQKKLTRRPIFDSFVFDSVVDIDLEDVDCRVFLIDS